MEDGLEVAQLATLGVGGAVGGALEEAAESVVAPLLSELTAQEAVEAVGKQMFDKAAKRLGPNLAQSVIDHLQLAHEGVTHAPDDAKNAIKDFALKHGKEKVRDIFRGFNEHRRPHREETTLTVTAHDSGYAIGHQDLEHKEHESYNVDRMMGYPRVMHKKFPEQSVLPHIPSMSRHPTFDHPVNMPKEFKLRLPRNHLPFTPHHNHVVAHHDRDDTGHDRYLSLHKKTRVQVGMGETLRQIDLTHHGGHAVPGVGSPQTSNHSPPAGHSQVALL
jgi:hypothetical protein